MHAIIDYYQIVTYKLKCKTAEGYTFTRKVQQHHSSYLNDRIVIILYGQFTKCYHILVFHYYIELFSSYCPWKPKEIEFLSLRITTHTYARMSEQAMRASDQKHNQVLSLGCTTSLYVIDFISRLSQLNLLVRNSIKL